MKKLILLSSLLVLFLASCHSQSPDNLGYQDLDVAAFKAKMSEPGIVLLDVRTPEETAQGMIEGASEIDYKAEGFEAKIDQLDKEKTYLIYCRSGNRSGKACKLMAEKGFKKLYNLSGGYLAWNK